MFKFTVLFILAFLGLCQAKPGLFDLFSGSECKPITDVDTCAIVYDDEDCEEGMYFYISFCMGLRGRKGTFKFRNRYMVLVQDFGYNNVLGATSDNFGSNIFNLYSLLPNKQTGPNKWVGLHFITK